jgi:hypothetical protein
MGYPLFSVIVADFDVIGIAVDESKTDSPLVIDGNGVLPDSVVLKGMQPIAARDL